MKTLYKEKNIKKDNLRLCLKDSTKIVWWDTWYYHAYRYRGFLEKPCIPIKEWGERPWYYWRLGDEWLNYSPAKT